MPILHKRCREATWSTYSTISVVTICKMTPLQTRQAVHKKLKSSDATWPPFPEWKLAVQNIKNKSLKCTRNVGAKYLDSSAFSSDALITRPDPDAWPQRNVTGTSVTRHNFIDMGRYASTEYFKTFDLNTWSLKFPQWEAIQETNGKKIVGYTEHIWNYNYYVPICSVPIFVPICVAVIAAS